MEENPLVLVADDEAANRLLIVITLRIHKVRIIQADDGLQALQLARAENPQLILLDMMMPQLDGFDVIQRLREDPHTASIPIMALSALAQETDIQRARDLGITDYITKPFEPRVLAARVGEILDSLPSAKIG